MRTASMSVSWLLKVALCYIMVHWNFREGLDRFSLVSLWFFMICGWCAEHDEHCWTVLCFRCHLGKPHRLSISQDLSFAICWTLCSVYQLQVFEVHLNVVSDWWFGTVFIFPYIGNNHLNWLIFFKGVETTNQLFALVEELNGSVQPFTCTKSLQ